MERELYMQAWGGCRELTSIAVHIAISPVVSKAMFGSASHMHAWLHPMHLRHKRNTQPAAELPQV